MKNSRDEDLAKRFYFLNIAVSIMLLIVIVISIFQFGAATFEGQKAIGIILPGKIEDFGWNQSQYEGLNRVASRLNMELIPVEEVKADKRSLTTAVDKLVKRRVKTVFFSNSESLDNAAEVSQTRRNISFFGIEAEKSDAKIQKYAVRYAEAYYLAGIIAGLKTSTNKVGFIAPHTSPNINQMINAFALGARKIKSDAQIFLIWTGEFKSPTHEEQAVRDLKANNIDVIAYFADGGTIADAAARARIDFISIFSTHQSVHNLATITVNWENIYTNIFRREKAGIKTPYTASIADRGIEVILNQKLNARGAAIFEAEVFEIKDGKNVFTGPITDNRGIMRVGANEVISRRNLDKMGYLVEGVKTLGN